MPELITHVNLMGLLLGLLCQLTWGVLALHCILWYRCTLKVTLKMTEVLLLGKIIEMKSQEGVTKSRSLIVGFLPCTNLNNSSDVKRDLTVYTS